MENNSIMLSQSGDIEACSPDIQTLYELLMNNLREIFYKTQETESYHIQHSISSNLPHVERLAEIMKIKKHIVEELITTQLSSNEAYDLPKSILHSFLKMRRELSSDCEDLVHIEKSEKKDLEVGLNTFIEEKNKAQLFSNIANDAQNNQQVCIRKVNQAFVEGRDDMNYVFAKFFPDGFDDLRAILYNLTQANEDGSSISTNDLKEAYVEYLLSTCIVERDTDITRIKFVENYNELHS